MTRAVDWQSATVEQIRVETPRVKSYSLRAPEWRGHRPGQHVEVLLTAPDGCRAQRSYSIASAPERQDMIELTVEVMPDGEVSPYFHEVVRLGETIRLRGPMGDTFTWTAAAGGPLLLIGGGSGVVPLMSMLRHRANVAQHIPALLLYSSRSPEEVIYREQLERWTASDPRLQVVHTCTRTWPREWAGYARRVDRAMLAEMIDRLGAPAHVYVCGPGDFVASVADGLAQLAVPAARIHTERFEPTGS